MINRNREEDDMGFWQKVRDLGLERSLALRKLYGFYLRQRFFNGPAGKDRFLEADRSYRNALVFRFGRGSELFHWFNTRQLDDRMTIGFPLMPHWLLRSAKWMWRLYMMHPAAEIKVLPWRLHLIKRKGVPFWHDMDLYLGPFVQLAVRWEKGDRQYVSFLFFPRLLTCLLERDKIYGRYEIIHELAMFRSDIRVSRWWIGHGYHRIIWSYRATHAYRHFGKLIRWNYGSSGVIGTDLSPEAKERLYTQYRSTPASWRDNRREMNDAIHGRAYRFVDENFPCRCIDCGTRFNPKPHGEMLDLLRCEDCYYKHNDTMEEQTA